MENLKTRRDADKKNSQDIFILSKILSLFLSPFLPVERAFARHRGEARITSCAQFPHKIQLLKYLNI